MMAVRVGKAMLNDSPENREENLHDDFLEASSTNVTRFKTIFDQSFQFIGLLRRDGVLLEANQTALEFLGLDLDEVIGKPFWYAYCWRDSDFNPSDPDSLCQKQQYLREAIARAVQGEFIRYEVEVIGKENQIISLDFSLKPVFKAQGEVTVIIAEGRNVTGWKQLAEKLQESEERWQLILQGTGDGIFDWNIVTGEAYKSPWLKEMLGYNDEEISNDYEGWRHLVHPEDIKEVERLIKTHLEGQALKYEAEYRMRCKDGSYKWILARGMTKRDENGKPLRMVGSHQDISRRKEIEEQLYQLNQELEERVQRRTAELAHINRVLLTTATELEKRNQELDQFAYVTSHDLKAPLRAIANLSQWIEEDLQDKLEEQTRHQMDLLRQRVHRMEALIDGLLEYSRVGRIKGREEWVNLETLLPDILDFIAPPQGFRMEVRGQMPTLYTESLLIRQVFTNLISNGIKHHHKPEGHLKIAVEEKDAFYQFSIADDGPGIAPENHEKIFQIFQTLDPGDLRKNTGIGLSLVKKTVESQGGRVWLESQLGQGSTFYFTWPKTP